MSWPRGLKSDSNQTVTLYYMSSVRQNREFTGLWNLPFKWNHTYSKPEIFSFALTIFWKHLKMSYYEFLGLDACKFCTTFHRSVDRIKKMKTTCSRKCDVLLWQLYQNHHTGNLFLLNQWDVREEPRPTREKIIDVCSIVLCLYAFFQVVIRLSWALTRRKILQKYIYIYVITQLAWLDCGLKYKMTNNLI